MEGRATLKFFRSYYEAAKMLESKEEQADYLMSILGYGFDGEEPNVSGAAGALFMLARPNIDTSNKRSDAGSIGGKASGKQTASKPQANRKQTASKPQPEEGSRKKEVGSKEYTPQSPQMGAKQTRMQAFDKFWALYPKKKSIGRAKTAWEKLNPSAETIRAIMEKLPLLIASDEWKKDGGQYIPYPATWLNAEGWNDEVSTSTTQATGGYTLGDSELSAIAKLQQLRDSLKGEECESD